MSHNLHFSGHLGIEGAGAPENTFSSGRAGIRLKSKNQFLIDLSELARAPIQDFEPVEIEGWMSKWIAVSALHKSIRRSRVEKALQMADLLLKLDPAYFWRRLPVIALEDVGHADPWVIARIGWACGKAQVRAEIGDRDLALGFVSRMASGAKDRITCDLTCLAQEKLSLARAAQQLTLGEAVGFLKDAKQDLLFRATVAISVVGGNVGEDLPMRVETVTIHQLADLYSQFGVDPEICSAIRWAGNRRQCREMAATLGLTAEVLAGCGETDWD